MTHASKKVSFYHSNNFGVNVTYSMNILPNAKHRMSNELLKKSSKIPILLTQWPILLIFPDFNNHRLILPPYGHILFFKHRFNNMTYYYFLIGFVDFFWHHLNITNVILVQCPFNVGPKLKEHN